MIQRVYIDTSVIGGCFDEEFEEWSILLMEEIKSGQKIAVISDITYREMELAPEIVQKKLFEIPLEMIENILTDDEVEALAENYIKAGAVSAKFMKMHCTLPMLLQEKQIFLQAGISNIS